jgi:hypothetical protein
MQKSETQLAKWKKLSKDYKVCKMLALVASGATILGWLILLHKISQTSMFALRFSDEVTETLGDWEFTLLIMTLISAIAVFGALFAKKRMKDEADNQRADLRSRLTNVEPGERARIESQLRELGA